VASKRARSRIRLAVFCAVFALGASASAALGGYAEPSRALAALEPAASAVRSTGTGAPGVMPPRANRPETAAPATPMFVIASRYLIHRALLL
jgi:hypothetical protein